MSASGDVPARNYTWSQSNCLAADDNFQVQPGTLGCWIRYADLGKTAGITAVTFSNTHNIVFCCDSRTEGTAPSLYPEESPKIDFGKLLRAAYGDGGPGYQPFTNVYAFVAPLSFSHSTNVLDCATQTPGSDPWKYMPFGYCQYMPAGTGSGSDFFNWIPKQAWSTARLTYAYPSGASGASFQVYNIAAGSCGSDPNCVTITQGSSDAGAVDTQYYFNFTSDAANSGMGIHNITAGWAIGGADLKITGVSGVTGVRATFGGKGGRLMADVDLTSHATMQSFYGQLKPDLIWIDGCTNDRGTATASQCINYIQNLVTDVRAGWPAAQCVVERPPDTQDAASTFLPTYGPAMKAFALANGCGFIDSSAFFGSYASAASRGYMNSSTYGTGATVTCTYDATNHTCSSYAVTAGGTNYQTAFLVWPQDGKCKVPPTTSVVTSAGVVTSVNPGNPGYCSSAPSPLVQGFIPCTFSGGDPSSTGNYQNCDFVHNSTGPGGGDQFLATSYANYFGISAAGNDSGPTAAGTSLGVIYPLVWTVIPELSFNNAAPTQTTTSYTTPVALTVKAVKGFIGVAPVGCSALPRVELYDTTSSTTLAHYVLVNSTGTEVDFTIDSAAVAANDRLYFRNTIAQSGCSTNASNYYWQMRAQ